MNFDLTDDHRLLEESVRGWGSREVSPHIRDLDRQHRFDPAILAQMADLGLLGAAIPAEFGGSGTDYISLGLACEELEYVDTSLRVILSVHVGLNSLTLLAWGTDEQKRRYLVPQAEGRRIATFGLTEPAAGSDARGIQTVALKKGDRYVLTGEKSSYAGLVPATPARSMRTVSPSRFAGRTSRSVFAVPLRSLQAFLTAPPVPRGRVSWA